MARERETDYSYLRALLGEHGAKQVPRGLPWWWHGGVQDLAEGRRAALDLVGAMRCDEWQGCGAACFQRAVFQFHL